MQSGELIATILLIAFVSFVPLGIICLLLRWIFRVNHLCDQLSKLLTSQQAATDNLDNIRILLSRLDDQQ